MTLRQKSENTPLVPGDGFKQIGSSLKDARLAQGRSVRDVSEQLRISVDFLTKLEAGLFDELPAPAYVMGYLRSYGRCVGLAPDPLVSRYMAITEGKGSKPSYKTPMCTRPPQRSAPAVASILVLCALIAYGGWFWLKTNSLTVLENAENGMKTAALSLNRKDTVIDVAPPDPLEKRDLVGDTLAYSLESSAAISSIETTIKESASASAPGREQRTDKPAPELTPNKMITAKSANIGSIAVQTDITGREGTFSTFSEAEILPQPKAETSSRMLPDELAKTQMLTAHNAASLDLLNSNGAIAKLRDPTKEITIQAVAASWVEIVRDNGEEVLAKLMQAGDSYVVEGNTSLFLSTGNAGGLMVLIGTDDPLSLGDIGEIVRDLPLATDKLRKAL